MVSGTRSDQAGHDARDAVALPIVPTLVIEASSDHGSVALFVGGQLAHAARFAMGRGRADALTPALQTLFAESGTRARDVGALVCGAGPGSFTSLRIAAATAKGFVSGRSVPLYAVPSPLLAIPRDGVRPADGSWVVLQDALRGDVFATAARTVGGRVLAEGDTVRLPASEVDGRTSGRHVIDLREAPARVDARHAAQLASIGIPVDVATWEPDYGRLAEAQVQWEASHGRTLPAVTPAVTPAEIPTATPTATDVGADAP